MKWLQTIALALLAVTLVTLAPARVQAGAFQFYTGAWSPWPLSGAGGTGCPTGPDGNTCVWPVDFHPVGPTWGGLTVSFSEPSSNPISANGNGNSCSATVDAHFGVELQWVPSTGMTMVTDPPPARVFLHETGDVWASASGTIVTATADDGEGDSSQNATAYVGYLQMNAITSTSKTPAGTYHERVITVDPDYGRTGYWVQLQASSSGTSTTPFEGGYPGGCTGGVNYSVSVAGISYTLY
jgi:hypothetical protein